MNKSVGSTSFRSSASSSVVSGMTGVTGMTGYTGRSVSTEIIGELRDRKVRVHQARSVCVSCVRALAAHPVYTRVCFRSPPCSNDY